MSDARGDLVPAGHPIRVVIADDHPVYRDGLRSLVERSSDLELVGEAATGAEAVAVAREQRPDVVVMDLRMPEMSGIEATRRIAELPAPPETRVLVLTMSEDDDSLFAAMRAGARGYFRKDADSGDLVHAIRTVAAGDLLWGRWDVINPRNPWDPSSPDDGGAGSPVRGKPSPDAGAGSAALPEPHEPDSEA